jgi:hypothetical protein
MKNHANSYGTSKAILLIRSLIVFALIAFVFAKPVYDLALTFSKTNVELSSSDFDQDDSQEEEDDTEEEKIEETFIATVVLLAPSTEIIDNNFNFTDKHYSDYRIGIIVPPPEVA